ncbi:MAG: asparagine synthase (glutamine-hydrolyzing) [Pseudomonadota bacterium]
MCGIVGIVQADNRRRYNAEDVGRMADAIVHRGPDDHGIVADQNAILGMRRLSIIDLAGGHQPIHNEDKTVWVVNNGEIYNYCQLRTMLIDRGHRFETNSDTEVLVHLYEDYGEDFLAHIEGMFAVALWDVKQRKLILARDRVGMKPVYYWADGATVAFASEIKSLTTLPGFSIAADTDALAEYTALGYAVAPKTIFADVRKLPPASVMVWQDNRFDIRHYWAPPTDVDESLSQDQWQERVREELRRSVQDHMVSDVPVGAFLSGGIDSSAIATMMVDSTDQELSTYSIGYRGGQVAEYYNELAYARTVADDIGTQHHEIEVQPDVVSLLPKLIWHLEEPISDSAIMTTFLVSELAAESVKVILSGVGGDELFAGYNRYLGDHYHRRYKNIPAWMRTNVLGHLARLLPSGRQNRAMDLARYAKRFIKAGEMDWRERYRFFLAIADDEVVDTLLGQSDTASRSGFTSAARNEVSEDELLRIFRIDWQTQLAENLLLLTDKMSMAVSLECRVPFLDHRLVELAATIPARYKLPDGRLKGLLKDALIGVLPDSIINRRKRGFGAPVGSWFKRELMPLRSVLLGSETLSNRGLLDPETVRRICADHDRGKEDYTDLILVMMNLEIWSRLFLDGQSHEDVSAELVEQSVAA